MPYGKRGAITVDMVIMRLPLQLRHIRVYLKPNGYERRDKQRSPLSLCTQNRCMEIDQEMRGFSQ
jgi:hypothetical protein